MKKTKEDKEDKEESIEYNVYDRVMEYSYGQGDVTISWLYLCKEKKTKRKKFIYVIETMCWGYCSPDIIALENYMKNDPNNIACHMHLEIADAMEVTSNCKKPFATVKLPISVNLLRGGYITSLKCNSIDYKEYNILLGRDN